MIISITYILSAALFGLPFGPILIAITAIFDLLITAVIFGEQPNSEKRPGPGPVTNE